VPNNPPPAAFTPGARVLVDARWYGTVTSVTGTHVAVRPDEDDTAIVHAPARLVAPAPLGLRLVAIKYGRVIGRDVAHVLAYGRLHYLPLDVEDAPTGHGGASRSWVFVDDRLTTARDNDALGEHFEAINELVNADLAARAA
jgi:hypothetical protein